MDTIRNQKHHLHIRSAAANILMTLADITESIGVCATYPGRKALRYYGIDGLRALRMRQHQRDWNRTRKRLKEMQMVRERVYAKHIEIALTEVGLQEAFRLRVLRSDILPDHQDCMVVFDIPETEKRLRQQLRRLLTNACFIPIQRSVWISHFDVAEALATLFKNQKTSGWIRVFIVEECRK